MLLQTETLSATKPLRVLFALPGLHRVVRGAEVAFESVAREIARTPGYGVTLVGSGFLGGLYETALTLAGFKYTLADGEALVRDGLLSAARSFWPSRFEVRKST